ncbi:TATA box-binding protein-associated factor RNA polymerase I subunit C-like [Tachypleus tridentatus]|uniref:TATA box-binding protein-associated factor RNA polymerase I subunit C-like n=1 Tax=Tachypleus tridentatus TaxID=6853 RepID=UPI003FD2FA77
MWLVSSTAHVERVKTYVWSMETVTVVLVKSVPTLVDKVELSKLQSHDGESWWWCDFGIHPRSLVVADRKVISVLDARTSNSIPLMIFNAVDNRSLLSDENVMVMQQHPLEVHQHFVATSFHLLVIDERVPSLPVLLWKHCLNTKPCYCSVVSLVPEQSRGELIALLGSQEGAQTSVFHLKTSGCNTVQPQSLSPPWYLSQPEDMVKLLKVQGLCSNHTVQQRLQAPLTGVCSIPHTDSSGFTAFQLTPFCDLFFQDFYADRVSEDKTFSASAGCPLTTPLSVIDESNRWIKTAKVKDHSDIKKTKSFKRVDFTEEFMALKERKPRAKDCSYCEGRLDESQKKQWMREFVLRAALM